MTTRHFTSSQPRAAERLDAGPGGAGSVASSFEREEVDAANRSASAPHDTWVDPRGLAVATEAAARLVAAFADDVLERHVWRDEVTVDVTPGSVARIAEWLRDEEGWALLSEISPCDRHGSVHAWPARFSVSWHVTKLAPGAPRLRVRCWVDEGEPVPSVMHVWPTADWHEREAYDMFGIEFTGRAGLRRLIMPEDWVGHPARKDYPMGGEPVTFTNDPREL